MLGIALLGLSWTLGWALIDWLKVPLNRWEQAALGWVAGYTITGWWLLGWAAAVGFSWGIPLATLLLAFTAGGYWWWRLKHPHSPDNSWRNLWDQLTHWRPFKRRSWTTRHLGVLSVIVFAVLMAWLLGGLFASRMLAVKNGSWYSGGGSWADLGMHVSFINYFRQQEQLELRSPIYAQEPTTYPFLINFLTAVLMKTDWTIQQSLFMTGWPMAWVAMVLWYGLLYRLFRSHWASWAGVLVYLGNGGMGWSLAVRDWATSGLSGWQFLTHLPEDYTIIRNLNLQWSNVLTTHILPQRGFAATLPMVVASLYLWWLLFQPKLATRSRLGAQWLLALFVGLSPWWYVHGHLVLLGLFAGLVLVRLITKPDVWRSWLGPVILAVALLAPQWWWSFTQSSGDNSPVFKLGWMAGQTGVLQFWWLNLGVALPVWLVGSWWLLHDRQRSLFLKTVISLLGLVMVACNLVIWQAYDWNNMKFMLLAYLAVSLIAAAWIAEWPRRSSWKTELGIIVGLFMTVSGGLSILKESQTWWVFANPSDLALAGAVTSRTPAGAIFLTADQHNHPITSLAGRPTLLGYRGWLWTHGLNYAPVEQDVKRIYAGDPQAVALLQRYGVQYVAVGPAEKAQYQVNSGFFSRTFPVIITSGETQVFQVLP